MIPSTMLYSQPPLPGFAATVCLKKLNAPVMTALGASPAGADAAWVTARDLSEKFIWRMLRFAEI